MTHGSALSAVFFQENIVSDLSAISMPIDLDRSNRVIVKRNPNKRSLNENKESDTSCYREIKISY
jgi:23S rRNA maturation mini-RNase III